MTIETSPKPGGGAGRHVRLSRSPVAPGWLLVWAALAVTSVLWTVGHLATEEPARMWPWRGPSLLLSAWAITLLAIILLATARSRMIEPIFGGLDRAVRLHRRLGPIAIGIVIVHVLLYVPPMIEAGRPVADLFVPFRGNATESLNAISFIALLVWTSLAYTRRLPYEGWLSLHGLMGPIFLATSMHALTAGPTVQAFEPLRFWMWLLVLVGLASWIYRVVLYRWFAPRFHYLVKEATQRSDDTLDLVLRPQDRRMIYEPGTFVFVNRPNESGGGWQLHPFSISSSPTERDLRLSIRMVGDFTRTLTTLKARDPIEVFGPFGGFTPHRHAAYRRIVLIGAGIGITPFLSILRFEASNDDFRRIWLWYVVRDAESAPYDDEIREGVQSADSYVDYELWSTSERGRLRAADVVEAVQPFDDYAVMMCGRPEFVNDMFRQFIALGVPRDRLIAEDFYFH